MSTEIKTTLNESVVGLDKTRKNIESRVSDMVNEVKILNDTLIKGVQSSMEDSISRLDKTSEEIGLAVNNVANAINDAVAQMQKKMMIMGGISILCAIGAVVVGLVL